MSSAGIFKQSMGARNREGLGLSYRPARLCSLAELVPWNRFLGSLKFKNSGSGLRFRSMMDRIRMQYSNLFNLIVKNGSIPDHTEIFVFYIGPLKNINAIYDTLSGLVNTYGFLKVRGYFERG
jgi:hypothetical protein